MDKAIWQGRLKGCWYWIGGENQRWNIGDRFLFTLKKLNILSAANNSTTILSQGQSLFDEDLETCGNKKWKKKKLISSSFKQEEISSSKEWLNSPHDWLDEIYDVQFWILAALLYATLLILFSVCWDE